MTKLLTAKEVAVALGCSRAQAYAEIKRRMQHIRVGETGVRVEEAEVERYKRARKQMPWEPAALAKRHTSTSEAASGGAGTTGVTDPSGNPLTAPTSERLSKYSERLREMRHQTARKPSRTPSAKH